MDEKETNETTEATTEDSNAGNTSEAVSTIEQANAASERLEKANAEARELMARNIIGGKIDAGSKPEEKKEETPAEYLARVEKGEIQTQ